MKNEEEIISINPNILIVDDVLDNLKVLGNILKSEGYKVKAVLNGAMALQVTEKEKPDLILLDIMMPYMDGFEVCRRIKKNPLLNEVPIIFISSLNDTEDIVKAFSLGGADYITKPFKAEEVKARVNTHLNIYNQRKELQQQRQVLQQQRQVLQQQSKDLLELNATKDKFFSIIAHDLRSPFNAFLGLTQIMADDLNNLSMSEMQEFSVIMRNSAYNLLRLLENLLHWSRVEQGLMPFEPEVVKLVTILDESIEIISTSARKKNIEIVKDISGDLTVFVDINIIQTIIRNLVSNAVKFTHTGGKISLSAKVKDNKTVEIAIKDSGIGMSPEMVENLFRLDVKSNRNGTDGEPSTGLGLLLCKEFVEKHGGRLWVESEEQNLSKGNKGGSTFYFTIPYNSEKVEMDLLEKTASGEETENQNNKERVKIKILIADDEKIAERIITIFTRLVSNQSFRAKTGIDAVEVFRKNPDIDLVLMDIAMPQMDGYEATRQIRQLNPDVVIIAQTAFSYPGIREKAIAAGCNDFITKPFSQDELIELIKKYFKI